MNDITKTSTKSDIGATANTFEKLKLIEEDRKVIRERLGIFKTKEKTR